MLEGPSNAQLDISLCLAGSWKEAAWHNVKSCAGCYLPAMEPVTAGDTFLGNGGQKLLFVMFASFQDGNISITDNFKQLVA